MIKIVALEKNSTRLYFIDAMRAWAILMMLQGHFIDGLLDNVFRDNSNIGFSLWKYFRGMTAPVFFTVSGFIFTYLLVRSPKNGIANPRVKKGIRRGLELLFIGYFLRLNLLGILNGEIYDSFYLVDVLHCIGLSILGIIAIYLLTISKARFLFPSLLLGITLLLFIFEPQYQSWSYEFLPNALANYFTKTNGSVFTIIPWFGYATFGSFLSLLFTKYKNYKHLYTVAIPLAFGVGIFLIFYSSHFFWVISSTTGVQLFADIFYNNYLFIRLGDVFIVFALFMLARKWLISSTLLKIGQSTLSIYIIHFIILYGSLTGLGIYQYLHHSLSPLEVIFGALIFMFVCTLSSLVYEKNKKQLHLIVKRLFLRFSYYLEPLAKRTLSKARFLASQLFGFVKN